MSQVSKRFLQPEIKNRMFHLFWKSIANLKTSQQTSTFFSDLLSDTEQIMLAKRYTIAVLLAKNHTFEHISEMIKVSPSTVNSVANWLKHINPHTQQILQKHLKDESWGQFIDRLEALIDSIPSTFSRPRDRGKIAKAKWQALKSRNVRSALR